MPSTVTVQQVVTYAQQHASLMPLTGVGGVANEPALSIANDTMTFLFGEPFPWKFNRKTNAPIFVTTPNKQDYLYTGACAFVIGTSGSDCGGMAIDLTTNSAITQSGSTVTVNLLESCLGAWNVGDTVFLSGVSQPGIAAVFTPGSGNNSAGVAWTNGFPIATIATNGKSFTFTYAPALSTDGAPGITDLSWLESATMIQTSSTAIVPYVWYLQSVRTLEPVSKVGIPDRISVYSNPGTGIVTLRLRNIPGSQAFTVTPVYQKLPLLLTSLSSTWTPFPDHYLHVLRQAFKAQALVYAKDPTGEKEMEKVQATAFKASGADDRETSEEYITPDNSIMSGFGWGAWDW